MQINFKTRAKARSFAAKVKASGKACKVVDNGAARSRYGVKIVRVKSCEA